jgi:glutamate-ammonia-ligase adenylyltransferase
VAGELSCASDIDVMFVYDGNDGSAAFERAEQLAARVVQEIGATTAEGQTFRVDTRLRPEGGQGPLARSLAGFAGYYAQWGLTWERQALTQARFVAGNAELGARFEQLATAAAYGRPFGEEEARDIRRMKARIERERIPPGEDRVPPQARRGHCPTWSSPQLLQLQHGGHRPNVRRPGTLMPMYCVMTAWSLRRRNRAAEAYRL